MYMPKLARFTARDPLPQHGAVLFGRVRNVINQARDENPYLYARNNPTMFVDPSGMVVTQARCQQQVCSVFAQTCYTYEFKRLVAVPPATPATACPPGFTFAGWTALSGDEATLAAICANLNCPDRPGCTPQNCDNLVKRLIETARTTSVFPFWTDRCQAWAFEFERRLGFVVHPCVTDAGTQRINIRRFGSLTTGHVVYKVTFCDETTVYFDIGSFGGGDNIFFAGDPNIPGDVTIDE